MSRYIKAGRLEDDTRYRPFPKGRCQWCGKKLIGRQRTFCAPSKEEKEDGRRYGYQALSTCAYKYSAYWYTMPRFRRAVLLRDNFTCQKCGARPVFKTGDGIEHPSLGGLHVDHIHPYSKGGRTELDNLQVLCARCNLRKGARWDDEVEDEQG